MRVGLRAAALLALIVIAYTPVFKAGFIWDDNDYVTANAAVQSPSGLKEIWLNPGSTPQYYPLLFTALWAQHKLWGLNPLGYHVATLLFHTLNVFLIWAVLRRLRLPGAWLAAALFAVHPVHVESVAWISEQKNTLSTLFYLAALAVYGRWTHGFSIHDLPLDKKQTALYVLSLFLFTLAMLSKTVSCSWPVVAGLLLWWKKGRLRVNDFALLLPFILIGVALAVTTILTETHVVGTKHIDWDLTIVQRFLIAGRAFWFYIGKLAWPHPLIFNYPKWTIDPSQVWAYLYPLAALALIVGLWMFQRKIGRGPLVGVLCFGVGVFPALGFVDVYPFLFSYVADHFQYLASIAMIALFAFGVSRAARVVKVKFLRRTYEAGALVLLLTFAALAHEQAKTYRDLETLWRSTLKKNPTSLLANNNLGVLLLSDQRYAEAIPYFEAVLWRDPGYLNSLAGLGEAYLKTRRVEAALNVLTQALSINPDFAEAHLILAEVHLTRGDHVKARFHLIRSLELKPETARFSQARSLIEKLRIREWLTEIHKETP